MTISLSILAIALSSGAVETELGSDITDDSAKGFLQELRKTALTTDAIACAVLYAVSQSDDVDVNEVIVRPTASAY
nr:hypothetical protein [Pleurocapsa sp. FMAR1]